MLEDLPLDLPLEESLDSVMGYLTEHTPRIKTWFDILINPQQPLKHHHLFFYNNGPDAFISFIVNRNVTFLPDWLSKIVQLYGGVSIADDTLNLYSYQQTLYELLGIFIRLCEFRIAMNFWIILNPYTQPWIIIVTMCEWFLESIGGILPLFFGIDFSGVIAISAVAQFADYIKNLVFTMPYLPSEGIEETIGSHQIYRFGGFPRLWYEYGIPDQLREEWYNNKPQIIEHFLKYYGDIDQDILPTRVLEQYYNDHLNYQTLSENFINLNNLSNNVICFVNHVDLFTYFDNVTNPIVSISDTII